MPTPLCDTAEVATDEGDLPHPCTAFTASSWVEGWESGGHFGKWAITEFSRWGLFIWQFNAPKELRAFSWAYFQFVPYVSNQAEDLHLDIEVNFKAEKLCTLASVLRPHSLPHLPTPQLKATSLRPYWWEGNSLNLNFALGWLPYLVANT